jgi:hypothetical protein
VGCVGNKGGEAEEADRGVEEAEAELDEEGVTVVAVVVVVVVVGVVVVVVVGVVVVVIVVEVVGVVVVEVVGVVVVVEEDDDDEETDETLVVEVDADDNELADEAFAVEEELGLEMAVANKVCIFCDKGEPDIRSSCDSAETRLAEVIDDVIALMRDDCKRLCSRSKRCCSWRRAIAKFRSVVPDTD